MSKETAVVKISPEALTVADRYLVTMDIDATAADLRLPKEHVLQMISKPEVKAYLDSVFSNAGYRNRFKLGSVLDELIDNKMQELRDNEVGSSKDIADLLALAHKMRMEELRLLVEAEKVRAQNIKNQTNIQINEGMVGGNYGKLIQDLLNAGSQSQ